MGRPLQHVFAAHGHPAATRAHAPRCAAMRRDAPNPITCDYPIRRSAEAVRRHERAKLPTQQGRMRFGITSHR
ncbi:hypothetical protein DF147_29795 [Burkholderia cenocepacia]|nr:hypothetical protein DF147_29795 [Burkholderia cenocepacia]RQV88084.1 hypothetical protein DF019_20375 [Burkholderia cenocepacia]